MHPRGHLEASECSLVVLGYPIGVIEFQLISQDLNIQDGKEDADYGCA